MVTVYSYSIQCCSVNLKVLEFFRDQHGGTIRAKPHKPKHKPIYAWQIKGESAYNLAKSIKYFCIDKHVAVDLFIKFGKTIAFKQCKRLSAAFKDNRNNLIREMKDDRDMSNITANCMEEINASKLTNTPTEADFPYLAGLIDAEGCFRVKKYKPAEKPNSVYAIVLEIGNTKLPIIKWLHERFGGSVTFIAARGKQRPSVTWAVHSNILFKLLPKIRPFLKGKQPICDKLIEFQETILPNGGDRHSSLFKALIAKRIEVRERIIDEIHMLNHKGS
jgi:hypothetical protein